MEEAQKVGVLGVGAKVPDFEMDVYLPDKKDFGKVKFSHLLPNYKSLILIFYPPDFTFLYPT